MKIKRSEEKSRKEKEERQKYERDREALRKMHEQLRKEKTVGKGFIDLKNRGIIDRNYKVTFAAIEQMHYSDFNSGRADEDFNPDDIVDMDDSITTEDEPLKRY